MNTRIKELVDQAGFRTESWRRLDGVTCAPIYKEVVNGNNLEKFAKLLVLDCISKAEDYGLGVDAVEQMKKDFGVEE